MGLKIDINRVQKDMFIVVDGQPYRVVNYEHVKPGKGQAFVRVKAKNMRTGNVSEFTFKSSDKIEVADFEQRMATYLLFFRYTDLRNSYNSCRSYTERGKIPKGGNGSFCLF